jgi:hypothetical protein
MADSTMDARRRRRAVRVLGVHDVRERLNTLVGAWLTDTTPTPIYAGMRGVPEVVLTPVTVWQRLLEHAASGWDYRTAVARAARLDNPTPAHATTMPTVARWLGLSECPVPVLRSRGVPRGADDLLVWPGAVDDLRQLARAPIETRVELLQLLARTVRGIAHPMPSAAGPDVTYTLTDLGRLAALTATIRHRQPSPRRATRRGGQHGAVELIAAEVLTW